MFRRVFQKLFGKNSQRTPIRRAQTRLQVEALEDRQLMSTVSATWTPAMGNNFSWRLRNVEVNRDLVKLGKQTFQSAYHIDGRDVVATGYTDLQIVRRNGLDHAASTMSVTDPYASSTYTSIADFSSAPKTIQPGQTFTITATKSLKGDTGYDPSSDPRGYTRFGQSDIQAAVDIDRYNAYRTYAKISTNQVEEGLYWGNTAQTVAYTITAPTAKDFAVRSRTQLCLPRAFTIVERGTDRNLELFRYNYELVVTKNPTPTPPKPPHITTLVWIGAGDHVNWSDPKNWNTRQMPQSGDNLVFPNGAPKKTVNDLLGGFTPKSIDIGGSGYSFSGNYICLAGSIRVGGTNNNFGIDTLLIGAPVVTLNGGSLRITSTLSGKGKLTIQGVGAKGAQAAAAVPTAPRVGAIDFDKKNIYSGGTVLKNTTVVLDTTHNLGKGNVVLNNTTALDQLSSADQVFV